MDFIVLEFFMSLAFLLSFVLFFYFFFPNWNHSKACPKICPKNFHYPLRYKNCFKIMVSPWSRTTLWLLVCGLLVPKGFHIKTICLPTRLKISSKKNIKSFAEKPIHLQTLRGLMKEHFLKLEKRWSPRRENCNIIKNYSQN